MIIRAFLSDSTKGGFEQALVTDNDAYGGFSYLREFSSPDSLHRAEQRSEHGLFFAEPAPTNINAGRLPSPTTVDTVTYQSDVFGSKVYPAASFFEFGSVLYGPARRDSLIADSTFGIPQSMSHRSCLTVTNLLRRSLGRRFQRTRSFTFRYATFVQPDSAYSYSRSRRSAIDQFLFRRQSSLEFQLGPSACTRTPHSPSRTIRWDQQRGRQGSVNNYVTRFVNGRRFAAANHFAQRQRLLLVRFRCRASVRQIWRATWRLRRSWSVQRFTTRNNVNP